MSLCSEDSCHFSDLKRDIPSITPKALSTKLSELIEYELIEKKVINTTPVSISYQLTEKGRSLITSLQPIQAWAQQYYEYNSTTNTLEKRG